MQPGIVLFLPLLCIVGTGMAQLGLSGGDRVPNPTIEE